MSHETTIAAIASGSGVGGVGIIRISGPKSLEIALKITHKKAITPRYATYSKFYNHNNDVIDEGIILYFPAPNSFTGEECVEFQGHGGKVVLSLLLKEIFASGADSAKPGEFTERAFLNGKLDLVQAEAIHDLVMSQTEAQTKAALRSLSGDFSKQITTLIDLLIELRVFIEASIDFSEEDIDFISEGHVQQKIFYIQEKIKDILGKASQGKLLTDGIQVVIAGKPNAGKSSLLNALSGEETAIVTDIEGTTRDTLKETIIIEGMPLHIIDTAGLRETSDIIEQEGIKRSYKAIENADLILWIHDHNFSSSAHTEFDNYPNTPIIHIKNKIDLIHEVPSISDNVVAISAKNNEGIDLLKIKILEIVNYIPNASTFSARERHVLALNKTLELLEKANNLLTQNVGIELVAEETRLALLELNTITGKFTTDDLLGEIFSSFCIGK